MNIRATVDSLASRRRFSSESVESRFRQDMTEFLVKLYGRKVKAFIGAVPITVAADEHVVRQDRNYHR